MYSKGRKPAHLLIPLHRYKLCQAPGQTHVFTVGILQAAQCLRPQSPALACKSGFPEWNEFLFPCFFYLCIPGLCFRVCPVEYIVRVLCELSSSRPLLFGVRILNSTWTGSQFQNSKLIELFYFSSMSSSFPGHHDPLSQVFPTFSCQLIELDSS